METKISKSYRFFIEKGLQGTPFTIQELIESTGWSISTVRTYFSKKWDKFITPKDGAYIVNGIDKFSEIEYSRMMSQANKNSQDPFKPELEIDTERNVVKAYESAMLAIDIYNRPATLFKSEGYIVMMIIAWTALFHAIFQKNGVKYNYVDDTGNDEYRDGDLHAWELSKCLREYFKSDNAASRKNLEFFIGLRNKIEHRFVPKLDVAIGGECQALLLNFDELITKEFGNYYALRESLAFPLQTSTVKEDGKMQVIKRFQGSQYDEVMDYIDVFREDLDDKIWADSKYSFRVYLIPRIVNSDRTSDLAIEFVKFDSSKEEDMEVLRKQTALIKDRVIQVANQGKFKPSAVIKEVRARLGKPFSMHNHIQAFKCYNVRPDSTSCKTKYCQYDEVHDDYVYTTDWIDYLVRKLSTDSEYKKITEFKITKT